MRTRRTSSTGSTGSSPTRRPVGYRASRIEGMANRAEKRRGHITPSATLPRGSHTKCIARPLGRLAEGAICPPRFSARFAMLLLRLSPDSLALASLGAAPSEQPLLAPTLGARSAAAPSPRTRRSPDASPRTIAATASSDGSHSVTGNTAVGLWRPKMVSATTFMCSRPAGW